LLDGLPHFMGPFLFSTTAGAKPVDGFSKAKVRLDAAMQALLGETKLQPFVIHDVRRTVRTRLSEIGVAPIVAELVIGHTLPGLLRVYDQWEHLKEKREALDRWALRLRQLVDPRPAEQSNVVSLWGAQ
jgi:integrase